MLLKLPGHLPNLLSKLFLLFIIQGLLLGNHASGQDSPPPDPPSVSFGGEDSLEINFVKKLFNLGEDLEIQIYDTRMYRPEGDFVTFASSITGDAEVIEIMYDSLSGDSYVNPLPSEDSTGATVEMNNNVLTLAPGEIFTVMYFPDTTIRDNKFDLIMDYALYEDPSIESTVQIQDILCDPIIIFRRNQNDCEEELPGPDGKNIGTIITREGYPVRMAAEELIFRPGPGHSLARIIRRTGAIVTDSILQLSETGELMDVDYLLQVDPSGVDHNAFAQLQQFVGSEEEGLVSNELTLKLMTLMLQLQMEGFAVSPNIKFDFFGSREVINPQFYFNNTSNENLTNSFTHSIYDVPSVWALLSVFDKDRERISVGIVDHGFKLNDDLRSGGVQCDIPAIGSPQCGPGAAESVPTVGNSLFGEKSYHGTGMATIIGGRMLNDSQAAGTGGQVVVPNLYRLDLAAYVFGIGKGIRKATDDGATVINISGGYPCTVPTKLLGIKIDLCDPVEVFLTCTALATAASAAILVAGAAAAAACGASLGLCVPCCVAAAAAPALAATVFAVIQSACPLLAIASGFTRSVMQSAVTYATDRGVTVVASAGNRPDINNFPSAVQEFIELDPSSFTTENWQTIPGVLNGVICVGSVDPSSMENNHLFGDRVDVWAPGGGFYFAPMSTEDINSPQVMEFAGATSGASAYISGMVASAQAVNPSLRSDPTGVRDLLVSTAYDDSELMGFNNPNNERGPLVHPNRFIEAAGAAILNPLISTGYEIDLNRNEPDMMEDMTTVIAMPFATQEYKGTIYHTDAPNRADRDYFNWTSSASGMECFSETEAVLQYPDIYGQLVLMLNDGMTETEAEIITDDVVGGQHMKVYRIPEIFAGETFEYFITGAHNPAGDLPVDELSSDVRFVDDNVYKITFGAATSLDMDGDGVCDFTDNCPSVFNPDQSNMDTDTLGDVCDNCPLIDNNDQLDIDLDGIGYVCDGSIDMCAAGDNLSTLISSLPTRSSIMQVLEAKLASMCDKCEKASPGAVFGQLNAFKQILRQQVDDSMEKDDLMNLVDLLLAKIATNEISCNMVGASVGNIKPFSQTSEQGIFPNPVADDLFFIYPVQKVELYSAMGRLMATYQGVESIDMSGFADGLYLIQVKNQEQIETFKVIKH